MELQDYSWFILTTIILFSFMLSLHFKTSSSPKLPPGPMKLPVIGNLHNLVGPLPHRTLRDLSRKYGPLMHLKMGEVSTLIVSSPDMAREFMKTHDRAFAQRPHFIAVQVGNTCNLDIAFAPYGEYWKQMRKICVNELLGVPRVKSFASVREDEARNLVEYIRSASSRTINLSEKFLEFTSSLLSRSAFGNKVGEHDAKAMISGMMEGTRAASGLAIADMYPSKKFLQVISPMRAKLEKLFLKTNGALRAIVDAHIEQGNVDTKEDLVDVLLRLRKSDNLAVPITLDHIQAVIADIFSAGTETTSATMEWTMAELMKNPRAMNKAQAEIRRILAEKSTLEESDLRELTYLKLVIKESLRLHPTVPLLLPRECREACTVAGYEIPTKTRVIVNAWAIGRDPVYWEDAESFVPERFADSSIDFKGADFELTPFGAGRRMCPGMSYALASVELVLAQLLYHFDWRLSDGDLDMTELFGVSVMMKNGLRLTAVPFPRP